MAPEWIIDAGFPMGDGEYCYILQHPKGEKREFAVETVAWRICHEYADGAVLPVAVRSDSLVDIWIRTQDLF